MLQPKVLDVKTRVNYCDADVYSEEDEAAVIDSQSTTNHQLPVIHDQYLIKGHQCSITNHLPSIIHQYPSSFIAVIIVTMILRIYQV